MLVEKVVGGVPLVVEGREEDPRLVLADGGRCLAARSETTGVLERAEEAVLRDLGLGVFGGREEDPLLADMAMRD